MKKLTSLIVAASIIGAASSAYAGISASPLLVFMNSGKLIQNVSISNDAEDTAYVQIVPQLVQNPGANAPSLTTFNPGDNPQNFGLMVSPLKMAINGNTEKNVRVVSLKGSGETDQEYILNINPISNPTAAASANTATSPQISMNIGVGYVIKVLVLANNPKPVISAVRTGTSVTIKNTGNSYMSFRNGQLCDTNGKNCTDMTTNNYNVLFSGNTWTFTIPQAGVVKFTGVYAENKNTNIQTN